MEKLIEAIKRGSILLVGEFRGSKVNVIRYVDKKSGLAKAFTATDYLVERAGTIEPILISQQVGDGEIDPATVKINAVKGKTYAFELSGLEKVRGMTRARMATGIDPLPV